MEAVIAVLFAVVVLFVLLPLLAVGLLTVMDIIWRQDIGWSKLIWFGVVLGMPGLGLLVYWLFRPKDFNPWETPGRPRLAVGTT